MAPSSAGEELVGQTRLPHAGGTEYGEQLAGMVGPGLRERGLQATQLARSADHGARATARRRFRAHGHETVRHHRSRLALQLHGVHGLNDGRVTDKRPRLRANQDLTRLRGLLEACGHVHRVTRGEALLRACDNLAGVDADPELECRPEFAQQPIVQLRQTVTQLGCSTHGPQRVVLVEDRDAEHRHHGVADELLHRPAVTFYDDPRRVEVAGHDAAERLRVESLPERRRASHVAEQQRHGLALLSGRRGGAQDDAAGFAETRSQPILMAATPTTRHARSLRSHLRRIPAPSEQARTPE